MDPVQRLVERDLLEMVESIARRRGVTVVEIMGPARSQAVSRARQECWHALRHHPERCYSYPEIGRLWGRDHATVISGCAAFERREASTCSSTCSSTRQAPAQAEPKQSTSRGSSTEVAA